MAQTSRKGRGSAGIGRRGWLFAGLVIPLFFAQAASKLNVVYDGDLLYPAAPSLHFLAGKVLDRLHEADTQAFISQLTLFYEDGVPVRQKRARFVVSYSLWDQNFTVAIPGLGSQEGLSQAEAEKWCLDNAALSVSGVSPDKPFRMRFELRAVQPRDLSRVMGDLGISLTSMIEIFSRKAGGDESIGPLETGWLRLSDLPRLSGRPARRE